MIKSALYVSVIVLFWGSIISFFVAVLCFFANKAIRRPVKKSRYVALLSVVGFIISVILIVTIFSPTKQEVSASANDTPEVADIGVIYEQYKHSGLRYEDKYSGKRYIITAKIISIRPSRLFILPSGVNLTMEKSVENKIFRFRAKFGEDQEDALKKFVVGETITFEGTLYPPLAFYNCELILE